MRNVDWAAQVTAGRTVPSGACEPAPAEAPRGGACGRAVGGEADDVEDEQRGGAVRRVLRWLRSWQLLEAEVDQEVAGEGEFGGDAVGELASGRRAQLGGERLPGVGLDLEVAGERCRAADEAGQRGPQDVRAWR